MQTPRTALKGTSLLVDAVLTQTGYAGQTVTLDVEDGGRIVGSQPVRLPADGEPASVRVRVHRDRGRSARVPLEGRAAARRGRHAEQPARRPDRHPRSQGAHPLLRGRAAVRDEVRAAGDQGRQEPAARHAAAHRREQVPPPRRRRRRRRARGRIPEDARGAVRLPRAHARQRRGERVQRRSAPHDRGVRRRARRRAADARRRARVRRGRLRRHAGRRRAAGDPGRAAAARSRT